MLRNIAFLWPRRMLEGVATVPWLTWLRRHVFNCRISTGLRSARQDSAFEKLRNAKSQILRLGNESPDRGSFIAELGSTRIPPKGDRWCVVGLKNEDCPWNESGTDSGSRTFTLTYNQKSQACYFVRIQFDPG